jgi:hypothetical protein
MLKLSWRFLKIFMSRSDVHAPILYGAIADHTSRTIGIHWPREETPKMNGGVRAPAYAHTTPASSTKPKAQSS